MKWMILKFIFNSILHDYIILYYIKKKSLQYNVNTLLFYLNKFIKKLKIFFYTYFLFFCDIVITIAPTIANNKTIDTMINHIE